MNDYKEKSPTKKTNKGFKVFSIFVIVIAIIFAGAGLGFLTASLNTKPGLIDDIRPPASSQIYDINGKLITNIHSEQNRIPVKLSKVPKNLQEAFDIGRPRWGFMAFYWAKWANGYKCRNF